MRSNQRLIAVTLAAALLLSVIGPGLAVADDHATNTELSISVNAESAVVTVTDGDGEPVDGATVTATVADEESEYAEALDDQYATGEDGTVQLPAPDEDVDVTVHAEYEGASADTDVTLVADDDGPSEDAFGQQLQQFKAALNGEAADFPTGHDVASWVTSNNPGNAPDHAGPKDDAGPPEHAGPDGETGPPEHAKGGNDESSNDKGPKGPEADDSDDEDLGGDSVDEDDDVDDDADEEEDVDEENEE